MPCFVDFEKKFNLNLIEIKVHVVNINEFKTPADLAKWEEELIGSQVNGPGAHVRL